eukprot:6117805-Amphidinium_carterae.1
MMSPQGGKRGNWGKQPLKNQQKQPQPQFRKDTVGTSWDCAAFGFYNFGYRSACFACERGREDTKGSKAGGPRSKAGAPSTKSSQESNQNRAGIPSNKQTLRKRIRAAKDNPVLMELLEIALEKLTATKQQALPLKDQCSKLVAGEAACRESR